MQSSLCIRCATSSQIRQILLCFQSRTDKCPAFVVDPQIARRALEKQRTDELEIRAIASRQRASRANLQRTGRPGMNPALSSHSFPGQE